LNLKNLDTRIEKSSTPTVTVCIATYNRKSSLQHAIECVRFQTCQDYELIIVDDCSQDGTDELLLKRYREDPKLIRIRHSRNRGLAAARNTALRNAKGKYFTFLDDDDRWEEDFLESFLKLAQGYDEQYCFCCGNRIYKKGGAIICTIPKMHGPLIHYIVQGHTPPVAAQFYCTSQIKKIGGYDERIKSGVDHDLWLRLAFSGAWIKGLPKCLAEANTDKKRISMTTSYENRAHGIDRSLEIWKQQIINNVGVGFYCHFRKCYRYYLCEKFFLISLLKGRLIESAYFFLSSPFKWRIIQKTFISLYYELLFRFGLIQEKKIIDRPLFPGYKFERTSS